MCVKDSYISTIIWYRCEHADVTDVYYIKTEASKIYSSLVWLCEVNERMYTIQNDNGYESKGNCGNFLPQNEIWVVRDHLRLNSPKKI